MPIAALALAAAFSCPVADAAPRCLGKRATIVRGAGNDVIHAGRGPDVIYAGGGEDRVVGGRGNDTICGGPGRDRIDGGRGSDDLAGGGGDDRLRGQSGNDRLRGGPGADRVDGGRGDDPLVSGGPGSFDVVVGGTGGDRIDGGPGKHDVASYATTTAPLQLELASGTARGAEHERLRGFEDALGGSGADTLVGDSAANRLDGGPGDDRLQASGPGDAAFGGAGGDACEGGFQSESSCGPAPGGGNAVAIELVRSIDSSASLVVTGTPGPDHVALRRSDWRGIGAVQAAMGAGDDVLSLHGVPHRVGATLDGGPGSDSIGGGAGEDTLYAGDDSVPDRLDGGPGDDQIFGVNTSHPRKSSGAARMIGGPGNDLMVGGQPCDGDVFLGGPGPNDSASFARVRNGGTSVRARIGGAVSDPGIARCDRGRISRSVEKIEGSPGPDRLFGDNSHNVLLGRGGRDLLVGEGGFDRCVGGGAGARIRLCQQRFP